MARPLRIERLGGRYHVTARGNERRPIFRRDADRFHFLGLLAELGERFGVRVHAYVLMDNHFHLLLETPEANLSRAMQWLGASYGMWKDRRHHRAGHLFQGRFRAVVGQAVSRFGRRLERETDAREQPRRIESHAVSIPFPRIETLLKNIPGDGISASRTKRNRGSLATFERNRRGW